MANIVILGAGLGGVPMALEMRLKARREDKITVINNRPPLILLHQTPG